MLSSGFSWGLKSNSSLSASFPSSSVSSSGASSGGAVNVNAPSKNKLKRRISDIEESDPAANNTYRPKIQPREKKTISKFKRNRTPNIVGQPLPINRIIEVLDKKNLQFLLMNLIQQHPELSQDFINLSPKPTVQDSLNILCSKHQDISNNLPYKCDIESNYSYSRIKPYLDEFFQCLSDFTLNYLPPVESNSLASLEFLDGITNLLHKLPGFKTQEFLYNRNIAYEQISHTWIIIIKDFLQKTPTNLIHLIDGNFEKKITAHDESSQGKFVHVLELIKNETNILESNSSELSNYSKNFSLNNSPMFGQQTSSITEHF